MFRARAQGRDGGSMPVDVVIVNYNGGGCLVECLRSLRELIANDTVVRVVDNASTDGSDKLVPTDDPRFHLIRLERNMGFAKANNIGAKMGQGDVIHFLNPDTICLKGMDELYAGRIEVASNILYSTAVLNPDGTRYPARHTMPMIADTVKRLCPLLGHPRFWSQGSSIVLRRTFFEALGGWPEDYFMYAEDLDLSWKANLIGKGTADLPCPVVHVGGGVTANVWSRMEREIRVQRATRAFYRKHGRMVDYWLMVVVHFLYTGVRNPPQAVFILEAKRRAWMGWTR